MFKKILSKFKKTTPESKPDQETADNDPYIPRLKTPSAEEALQHLYETAVQQPLPRIRGKDGVAMDSAPINTPSITRGKFISPTLASWYSSQSFIGYTLCAILAQQWLVDKACTMPAEDAIRNDFEITVNGGNEVPLEIKDDLRNYDTQYRVLRHLKEFTRMNLIFGLRVAMFVVEGKDKDYYEKPFNLDGVTPGSYKGISQIDPYWLAPGTIPTNPASIDFYAPSYWLIGGMKVHKSHLVIINTGEVADILKPTYFYGGVSLPQKIYERVYQAERTANEGSQLALTKRTDVYKTDIAKAMQNVQQLQQKLEYYAHYRDNYGVKLVDVEEDIVRLDTALSDLDAVIMNQYQLVAAIANVPSTKLLGVSPKGFNATGEYEEASYHEYLESIQSDKLTPLLTRHYEILMRSEIAPKYGIKPFDFKISWNPCERMTAEKKAAVNKTKSETAVNLANVGAVDGQDERDRIISDPESGYSGLAPEAPVEPVQETLNFENPDDASEE